MRDEATKLLETLAQERCPCGHLRRGTVKQGRRSAAKCSVVAGTVAALGCSTGARLKTARWPRAGRDGCVSDDGRRGGVVRRRRVRRGGHRPGARPMKRLDPRPNRPSMGNFSPLGKAHFPEAVSPSSCVGVLG